MKLEELYNEWVKETNKLSALKGFFQNDFSRLLKDGYTSKEEVAESAEEFTRLFNKNMQALIALKTEIYDYMIKQTKEG